jgi:hypothetical protein
MSAVASPMHPPVAAPRVALLPPLSRQETRRLLLHPLMLLGQAASVAALVQTMLSDGPTRGELGAIGTASTFFTGVLGLFAANLLATRDHRSGAGELLAPLPAREHDRTKALCLASVAPAFVALVVVMVFHAVYLATGSYGVVVPGTGLLLQGPATVLGGCLLGVMVGRWVPARGAAVLTVVALVAVNVWTDNGPDARRPFGFMTSWQAWTVPLPDGSLSLIAGSPAWHVVYLLALCGLAVCGALLRSASRRSPLLAVGAALAVVAGVAGCLQVA